MSRQQLPQQANFRQLRRQAKDLLKAYRAGAPDAYSRVRESLARLEDASDEALRAAGTEDAGASCGSRAAGPAKPLGNKRSAQVFETGACSRSATSPGARVSRSGNRRQRAEMRGDQLRGYCGV